MEDAARLPRILGAVDRIRERSLTAIKHALLALNKRPRTLCNEEM